MFLPARIDVTTCYQFGSDGLVQLVALVICRTDHKHARAGLIRSKVVSGYVAAAIFDVGDFADVAAVFQNRECLRDFAFGGVHHRFAELGIALAADGIELRNRHSNLLHLTDGPARIDCMMLALVAHENDPLYVLLAPCGAAG